MEPRWIFLTEGFLQQREQQAYQARKGDRHRSKLTQNFVTILCSNRLLVRGDRLQNFEEMFDAMRRELIVFALVSIRHPKITLDLVHVASPCFIFLREAGSCQKTVSLLSSGRKARSNKGRRIRFTHRRIHQFPCTRTQKSSM